MDNNDLEVSEEDVETLNEDEEENRPKKTKEEMPKNLSFVKGEVDSDDVLPIIVNMALLQVYKIM